MACSEYAAAIAASASESGASVLMDTGNVENVFVAGKLMKWHGKLVGVDLNGVRRTIEKSGDAMVVCLRSPAQLPEAP